MKEAIAAWKQRLVHLDLFIISFQHKAAGLHAARRTLRPQFSGFFRQRGLQLMLPHPVKDPRMAVT